MLEAGHNPGRTANKKEVEKMKEVEKSMAIMIRPTTNYYEDWTVNDLRNGIWQLCNGMGCKGPYCDKELLRAELRRRGLSDEGYHNT
jgi:hypothetical protein